MSRWTTYRYLVGPGETVKRKETERRRKEASIAILDYGSQDLDRNL